MVLKHFDFLCNCAYCNCVRKHSARLHEQAASRYASGRVRSGQITPAIKPRNSATLRGLKARSTRIDTETQTQSLCIAPWAPLGLH